MKYLLFLLTLLTLLNLTLSDDKITSLPDLPKPPNFNQYAGYLTVNEKSGRALYYWFTESQSQPSIDPVVLWLTGGPGCSSLLALFTENGPFVPNKGGSLEYNDYSWNKVANMLWIESPAFVGFSYSNTSSDISVGDDRAADDVYLFLVKFFDLYPSFNGRDFWITGESYGGHYVPQLALRIVNGNKQNPNKKINLRGIMAGNAWTYMPYENEGAIDTWWQRGLVPKATVDDIKSYCNLSYVGPLKQDKVDPVKCEAAINQAGDQMGHISIYNIYADVCTSQQYNHIINQFASSGSTAHHLMAKKVNHDDYDPCIDKYLTSYLNRLDVQRAIHIRNPRQTWRECSNRVDYSYDDVAQSVIPVYQKLFKENIDILVYAGDVDAIVPYSGSLAWITDLKMKIFTPWRPWIDSKGQVGGYTTEYEFLTFTTVRGAGHQVPTFQPDRALLMFYSFLTSSHLPTSEK